MRHCVICRKPLSLTEGVLIEKNKQIFVCDKHISDGQLLIGLIEDLLFILDGKNHFALIWDTLRPVIKKEGFEKTRLYLQDSKSFWCRYLEKKNFSNMQNKVAYFKKALENNLQEYQQKSQKAYEKINIDDGTAYKTIVPKRKKRKTFDELLGG